LANPPPATPAADLAKYKQQHTLVKQILATFRKPSYNDAEDSKEIARLVGEMQDLGGPPKEIMGDMPDGFVSACSLRIVDVACLSLHGVRVGLDAPETVSRAEC
jgi:hypothetical protein